MKKIYTTASDLVLDLSLQGRHDVAAAIAQQVAERYREDPITDGTPRDHVDGVCDDCKNVFRERDCQHGEFEPLILCDRCYLNRRAVTVQWWED